MQTLANTQQPLCRCFFGDFTDKAEEPADRRYTEIPSVAAALAAVEEALADYNGTSKRPMHLAMFLYALEHVSRISRLMKQPGGHMLLIGVGGSGRQSLTKLAAFMAGVELFQVGGCRLLRQCLIRFKGCRLQERLLIERGLCCVVQVEISKNYSRADWREDLKRLLRRAGCDGKRIMLLFTDSQVILLLKAELKL